MKVLQDYLWHVYHLIAGNYYVLGALAVVVILLAIKKPKILFKIAAAVVGVIAFVYILVFLETAMFSGHGDRQDTYDVEKRTGS